MYLSETTLQSNKSILFSLRYVFGINYSTSLRICKNLGFSANLKVKHLTPDQIQEVETIVHDFKLQLSGDLKKKDYQL